MRHVHQIGHVMMSQSHDICHGMLQAFQSEL